MTIEQVIRVVFDDNAYTRNVANAAAVSGKFDASVNSVTNSLAAMSASARNSGAAQALAATNAKDFFAALDKQSLSLTAQSSIIGKTVSELISLKGAELGVAQQAAATAIALEQQARAFGKLSAGARAVQNIIALGGSQSENIAVREGRAVDFRTGKAEADANAALRQRNTELARGAAAEAEYRQAVEAGVVTDLKAARAKQDVAAAQRQRNIELAQSAAAEASYRNLVESGAAVDLQAARAKQAAAQLDRNRNSELVRAAAAEAEYRAAVQAGTVSDIAANRAKQDLIAQLERETAALTRLAAVPRGTATGQAAETVRATAAADPEFAARAQPALVNLGAAQAARDQAVFIASLERTAAAAGRTRAELLALEAAERGVSAQAAPLIARIAAVDKSFHSFSKTGRLTALELQQVGFQLNDFFVQVASGQGLFLPLIQQGSQLSGTFGGIGAAVRAVGSLITPVVGGALALGGAAVGIGLAAAATERWQRSLSDLQATLQGTGRGGQFSNGQLAALIEQISQAPNVTREAAIKTVAELARIGNVSGALFGDLGRLAADFARVTGTDVPTAAKALGAAFAQPEQGAKTLEAALGRLSIGTLATVQRLSDVGDRVGAQRALFAGLQEAIRGLAEQGLTPLQRATNDLGNSWERLMGTLRESDGLKSANRSLSELVDRINTAVANAPKLGLLGTLAAQSGPLAAVARGVQSVLPERQEPGRRSASGIVTTLDGTPANVQGSRDATKALKDEDKTVLALIESYKSQGSEIAKLTTLRQKARDALARAPAGSDEAALFKDRIAGLNERIQSLNKKGGGDPDRGLKRAVAADIENARRQAQSEVAIVAARNEALKEQYDAGLVDIETFFARRAELNAQAAQAEQNRIATQVVALRRQETQGKKEETRTEATDRIVDAAEQQRRASAQAEEAASKLTKEARRERLQIDRQIADIDAEIAQLAGDEAGAERARNAQRIEQARILAAQRFGDGSPEAQSRVETFTRLLALQADSNELQRQAQGLSQRSAIEEERFLIAAQAGAATREEIERGLFDIRSRAIVQLAEQVRQADAQVTALGNAATPNSPAVLFALQLRLELERLTQAVDPAMERLRSVAGEVADAFGEAAGAITLNFRDIGSAFKSLEQSLLKIGTRELVEKPFSDFIRKQLGSVIEPGQGGGLGQGIRDIFGVAVKGAATGGGSASQPANPFSLTGVFGSGGNLGNSIGLPPGILNLSGGGGLSGGAPTDPFSSAIQSIAGLGTAAEGSTDSLGGLAQVPTTFALLSLAQAAQAAALALGSLSGGAGASKLAGGGGGLFSSITGGAGSSGAFDFIGDAFISLFGLAEGGPISGPGTATSDSIPILASDGEFMVRARSVQQPGATEFLSRFNAIGMGAIGETFLARVQASASQPGQIKMPRGFADGGLVGRAITDASMFAGLTHFADGGLVGGGEMAVQRMPAAESSRPAATINLTYNAPPGESRATHLQNARAMYAMGAEAQRRNG